MKYYLSISKKYIDFVEGNKCIKYYNIPCKTFSMPKDFQGDSWSVSVMATIFTNNYNPLEGKELTEEEAFLLML